jgi:hypothetical protein
VSGEEKSEFFVFLSPTLCHSVPFSGARQTSESRNAVAVDNDMAERFELGELVPRRATDPPRKVSTDGFLSNIRHRKRGLSSPPALSWQPNVSTSRESLISADPESVPQPAENTTQPEEPGHKSTIEPEELFRQLQGPLTSRLSKKRFTLLLALITCATVIFTIYFAYNSSLAIPRTQTLIFSQPQYTVLTVNILSQASMMLLAQLTDGAFDNVRWAFASSKRGAPAMNFFTLGTSATYVGNLLVLYDGLKAHYMNLAKEGTLAWRWGGGVWSYQRHLSIIFCY